MYTCNKCHSSMIPHFGYRFECAYTTYSCPKCGNLYVPETVTSASTKPIINKSEIYKGGI